jgi:hypothetical protein
MSASKHCVAASNPPEFSGEEKDDRRPDPVVIWCAVSHRTNWLPVYRSIALPEHQIIYVRKQQSRQLTSEDGVALSKKC